MKTTARRATIALALSATLLMPAFGILGTDTAVAEPTPVVQGKVRWQNVPTWTTLYFARGIHDDPDPTQGSAGLVVRKMTTYPAHSDPSPRGQQQRGSEAYAVTTNGQATGDLPAAAVLQSDPLKHYVNISGNDSIIVTWYGTWAAGHTWTVTARSTSASQEIGRVSFKDDGSNARLFDPASPTLTGLTVKVPIDKRWPGTKFEFKKDSRLEIRIEATQPSEVSNPIGGGATVGQWRLEFRNAAKPSRVELNTLDAIKAAGWVTDHKGEVKTVFRPNETPDKTNRIYAFFAVKSAFGGKDVRCIAAGSCTDDADDDFYQKPRSFQPRLTFLDENKQPYPIGRNRESSIDLDIDSINLSAREDGTWTYKMPTSLSHWDFTRDLPGEYTARFSAGLRADDSSDKNVNQLDVRQDFVISNQGLTIRPFDDDDATTFPTPLENLAHEIQAGGSSAYLMLVRNRGSSNDTVQLRAEQVSATPATGWVASIGGPKTLGDGRLRVEPGKEELVVVTLRAPPGAKANDKAVFQLTATSGVDVTVKAKPQVFSATVSSAVRKEVGIVGLNATEDLKTGLTTTLPFYAWNRGTRPQNLSVSLNGEVTAGWSVKLLDFNGIARDRLTFNGVPPGEIVTARLSVTPSPTRPAGDTYSTTVNVTFAEAGGPGAERKITFRLLSQAAFDVKLLQGILGTEPHRLEMACWQYVPKYCSNRNAIPDGTSKNDSVNGTWFRVWVTNTGTAEDRYKLEITDFVEERDTAFNDPFSGETRFGAFPESRGADLRVVLRNIDGTLRNIPGEGIALSPGETGEAYVWVGHQENSAVYGPSDFSFTLKVTSQITKREIFRHGSATASDNEDASLDDPPGHTNGAKLEAVQRYVDLSRPLSEQAPIVNITRANDKIVRDVVYLGANVTYYSRVTNAASWRSYTDGNTEASSDVVLHVSNPLKERGWDVKMRKVNGTTNQTKNPFVETLRIDNYNDKLRRAESFWDEEVEIRVIPPLSNSTFRPLAGDVLTFDLTATTLNAAPAFLSFVTTVADFPNVTLSANTLQELVHPGGESAFVLHLRNNGSSSVVANLKARVEDSSTLASQWTVTPREQNFDFAAHENRTVALIVKAPAGVAAGDQAQINVTIGYPDPLNPGKTLNRSLDLKATVKQQGTLRLGSEVKTATAAPGKVANFTFTVRNTDPVASLRYRVTTSPIPNWSISWSPETDEIRAGETRNVFLTLTVPDRDVFRGRSYATTLKVEDLSDSGNFDIVPLSVTIIEGVPIPVLEVGKSQDLVNRGGSVTFPISIKNFGNAPGSFPVEARATAGFQASLSDAAGKAVSAIQVGPNERKTLTLTLRAPIDAREGTTATATVSAFSPNDFSVRSDVSVKALIHDYAVDVEVRPARADVIPGQGAEFSVKVTNVGNGNDTFTLSTDFAGTDGWRADYATQKVNLAPGASTTVRLIMRTPREDLPPPRPYAFTVIAESEGAKAASLAKTDTAGISVNVLSYRPFDVDNDGFPELAVDANRRSGDGFERFIELRTAGVDTQFVDNFSGKQDGKINFLLEVPEDGVYTGIANVYFDPDVLFVVPVKYTPDVTGDSTPDYLLDTDNDGVLDHAWDTATRRLMRVNVIHVFGAAEEQYLIDTDGNGSPDKYFDPKKGLVTRVTRESGASTNTYGLDTSGDGIADKYYDTSTREITAAPLGNTVDLLRVYWWFFALFVGVILVAAWVVAKRKPKAPEPPLE